MARLVRKAITVLAATLMFIVGTITASNMLIPYEAHADITMSTTPNTGNILLVCRFNDDNNDIYNKLDYTGKTTWQSLIEQFNSVGTNGTFKNYIATVSLGKLNVETFFPQNIDGTKMEYLDLDMASTEYSGANDDAKLIEAITKAFNQKYPKYNVQQANIDDDKQFLDNLMITVQFPNGKTITSHQGSGSALGGLKLGEVTIDDYEIMNATQVGGLMGSLDAVPAHEYLHSFNALDLYRAYGTAELARYWDIMGSAVPGLLPLAITREDMGFGDTIKFVDSGTYELGTYTSGKTQAVAFKSPLNDDEYFIAEYREGDLSGANGYKADKRIGNKSAFDTSGMKDGVIVYRINKKYGPYSRGGDGTGNRENDYVYIFRPNDTSTISLGGDGTGDLMNANVPAGSSIGTTNSSDKVDSHAICYSNGQNSMITLTVKKSGNGSATIQISKPDYTEMELWNIVNASGTVASFQSSNYVNTVKTAKLGNNIYTLATGYNKTTVYKYNGTTWALIYDANISDASIVSNNNKICVLGIDKNNVIKGKQWDTHGNARDFTSNITDCSYVNLTSHDDKIYLTTISSDSSTAKSYDIDSSTNSFITMTITPAIAKGEFLQSAERITSNVLATSDFFGNKFNTYKINGNTTTIANTINMTPSISTSGTYDGQTLTLVNNSTSGEKPSLFKISNDGTAEQIVCNILENNDHGILTSDDNGYIIALMRTTGQLTTAIAYRSLDGITWAQIGKQIASPVIGLSGIVKSDNGFYCATRTQDGLVMLRTFAKTDEPSKPNTPSEPSKPIMKYTVVYDANGGTVSPTSEDIEAGKTATTPTPTRAGYSFAGWYSDPLNGTRIDEFEVTANTTLYAHWTANKYAITFNSNGGNQISPMIVSYGDSVVLPDAIRDGYTFVGWYNENGSKVTNIIITSSVNLTAHWEKKQIPSEPAIPSKPTIAERTIPDGEFIINSYLGGSVDISAASKSNSANAQIWDTNYTKAQRYKVTYDSKTGTYEIINVNSGKALDVLNGIATQNQNVQQYDRNETKAQRWIITNEGNGTYAVKSALNQEYCLTLKNGKSTNGTNIDIEKYTRTRGQKFIFRQVNTLASGPYNILTNTGKQNKVIDVSAASRNSGANVQQWHSNGTIAQRFSIQYDSKMDCYTISNISSNKALDVTSALAFNGANIQQWDKNGTTAQQWISVDYGNDTVVFASCIGGYVMDVASASNDDGANIQLWTPNGTNAQKFILREA